MNRRLFWLLLTAILLALTHQAKAQQLAKIPRIGYIATAGDINNPGRAVEEFQQGLRNLGYIEGKNIIVEYRYPGTEPELTGNSKKARIFWDACLQLCSLCFR